MGLKNLESAKHFFERALYDEPDSSDACAGLAEVFYLSGKSKEAKTMFEWAVIYNPGNIFARERILKLNAVLGLNKSCIDSVCFECITEQYEEIYN